MELGVTVIIAIAFVLIFLLLGTIKRARHKSVALIMISLTLFLFFSFVYVAKTNHVSLNTVSGLFDATKIYFNWLGSAFGNLKSITGYATKLDWEGTNRTKQG